MDIEMDVEMDIIKTGDTAIGEYEEVLLRRDNLRKEAEQYHMAYIREFGDLITKAFEQKVECIRKKKMIAYCQRQVNMGKKIEGARLDTYIETEMVEYREELESMAKDVRAAKNSKKISPGEVMKIKKTYHGLAKKIHPDLHPELKEDERLKAYWQRIMIAYNYNQLKDLEELELLVSFYLNDLDNNNKGIQIQKIHIDDLADKIAAVEAEIKEITSTNPYLYKAILADEMEKMRRKQEYRDEIATYEMYSAQLDDVLSTFDVERGKLS